MEKEEEKKGPKGLEQVYHGQKRVYGPGCMATLTLPSCIWCV